MSDQSLPARPVHDGYARPYQGGRHWSIVTPIGRGPSAHGHDGLPPTASVKMTRVRPA